MHDILQIRMESTSRSKAIDRRNQFADILIELINHKPVNKITINDIVEKANISRTAFYHCFENKSVLVFWIFQRDADKVLDNFIKTGKLQDSLKKMFDIFLLHEKFYEIVSSEGEQNSFSHMLFEYLLKVGRNFCATYSFATCFNLDVDFSIRSYCHSIVDMFCEWMIHSDNIKSSSEIARRLVNNLPAVILSNRQMDAEPDFVYGFHHGLSGQFSNICE